MKSRERCRFEPEPYAGDRQSGIQRHTLWHGGKGRAKLLADVRADTPEPIRPGLDQVIINGKDMLQQIIELIAKLRIKIGHFY